MPYPDVTYRSELPPVVLKELDQFAAQLAGFLSSAGFASNGSFNTITVNQSVSGVSLDVLTLPLSSTTYAPTASDSGVLGAYSSAYSAHRLVPSADRTVIGIQVEDAAVGSPGQVLILINDTSSYAITWSYDVSAGVNKLLGVLSPVVQPPGGVVAWYYDEVNLGWRLVAASKDWAVTPVGSIVGYGGASAPTGWLLCDGSVVATATYAKLSSVLGTAYNTGGEGAGNFRLPDLRQRFPLGKAASAGTGFTLGSSGGGIDHTHGPGTLGTDSQGSHDHGGTTGSESSHTHDFSDTLGTSADGAGFGGTVVNDPNVSGTTSAGSSHSHTISSGGSHTHTVTTGATASDNPPYQVVNFIVKY